MKTGCTAIIIILIVSITLGTICTNYTINFWGSYFTKKPVDLPLYMDMSVAIVLSSIAIPSAIITLGASYIIDNKYYNNKKEVSQ